MWHSRALAVAAVAAALTTGVGCVTRGAYRRDLAAEQGRTEAERLKAAALHEKLDQANKDVKKAWDALAQKAADYTANQKAADEARRQVASLKQQVEQLQNSFKEAEKNAKTAAEKAQQMKKLQDQFDAAQEENADLRDLVEEQKAQIAELKARLGEKSSVPAQPLHPTPMTPTTSAPAPAEK